MEPLIYSYHFTVITMIIITFASTILSMAKIRPFGNVPPATTRMLVVALLVELAGAFVGVYSTLPQLRFDVSENYRFEITYDDILAKWIASVSDEERELIDPFMSTDGMQRFLRFQDYVSKYREIRIFSKRGGTDWLAYYDKFMSDEEEEMIELYRNTFAELPSKIRKAEELLKIYTRMYDSSGRIGTGYMWASTSGDFMKGIVVYSFPGSQRIPTVLKFEGQKSETEGEACMMLSFEQSESAFFVGERLYLRPGGGFSVELRESAGAYRGKFEDMGEIRIQEWDL